MRRKKPRQSINPSIHQSPNHQLIIQISTAIAAALRSLIVMGALTEACAAFVGFWKGMTYIAGWPGLRYMCWLQGHKRGWSYHGDDVKGKGVSKSNAILILIVIVMIKYFLVSTLLSALADWWRLFEGPHRGWTKLGTIVYKNIFKQYNLQPSLLSIILNNITTSTTTTGQKPVFP